MSSNFLVFNTNNNNMLSDTDYSTDQERISGVSQGISRSILFNKVLKQTSAMSAALGTVLSDRGYNAIDIDQPGLVQALSEAFPQNRSLPVATLIEYTGKLSSRAPEGFLFADGSVFSPILYPELAEAYRLTNDTFIYGQEQQSNGAWWPKVPDFRGAFIRGLDNGKGKDPNRSLGVPQNDAIRNITGELIRSGPDEGPLPCSVNSSGAFYTKSNGGNGSDGKGNAAQNVYFDASRVVPTANENRPYNYAVNFLVVAKSGFNLGVTGGGGSSSTLIKVRIPVDEWDTEDNTAIITVEGIDPDSNLDMGLPIPTSFNNSVNVAEAGLVITGLSQGEIIFTCREIPQEDLDITIRIWEE